MPLPVWLETDLVITCEFTQILLKLSEKLLISLSLVQRHKGVDVCKFFPCDRCEFRRTVQFHGAGSQWNHAVNKGNVFIFQFLHIPDNICFRVVTVNTKHRIRGPKSRYEAMHILLKYKTHQNLPSKCKSILAMDNMSTTLREKGTDPHKPQRMPGTIS